MANATDRLNQLQEYMNFYQNNARTQNGFGNGIGNFSYTGSGGGPATMADWANSQLDSQNKQQNMQDENAMFKGMYSGNGQSPFGAPPAYVQPNNQQQQPNPYSARAMQLNNNPYSGLGDGGAASNSLAQMFRNGNYKAGG